MNITEFEAHARNSQLTRENLETMVSNALTKGNREFADVANQVLLERFPNAKRKGGGATPTTAIFLGRSEQYPSGKEAYVWLVERLRGHSAGLLEMQEKSKFSERSYFAKSAIELFPEGSVLADKDSNFSKLQEGWYANVNLNQRVSRILCKRGEY